MLIKKILSLILLFCSPALTFCQSEDLSADSIYAYIKHLTVNIGPRPMGSVNERIALDWTVNKFKSFGADTAYVMEFKQFKRDKR